MEASAIFRFLEGIAYFIYAGIDLYQLQTAAELVSVMEIFTVWLLWNL